MYVDKSEQGEVVSM